MNLKSAQPKGIYRSKLSRTLMLGALIALVLTTMIPFQIFGNQRSAHAAVRPAVFGYITWQYLSSSNWNTDAVLGALTHIIAPALVASSASSPSVRAMYGDSLGSAYPLLVNAAHPRGIKVLPYFYTGSQTGTSLNAIVQAGTLSTLVTSIKNVILQYNLDGIDLDLEETMNPSNNNLFIDALYAALNPYGKMITLEGFYGEVPGVSPDVSLATSQKVDYIHVMAYDMWGYSDQNAGMPHSTYVDSVAAVQKWINAGYPRTKLNMAIPFFGKSVTPYAILEYNKIVDALSPSPSTDSGTINGITYSWNGMNTVKAKADWVAQNGIGGVMVFATGYDKLNQSTSLLQTIDTELRNSSVTTPPVTAPPAGSNTLYTSYLASEQGTSLGNYALQTFTPQTTHTVKQVKLNLYNSGAAGTLTVSIRATNPSTGEPTGGDLATSAAISETTLRAAWSTPSFDLGSGYLLQAGTKYAFYLRSTATGLFGRVDTAGTYSGGSYMVSSNGLSWTNRALWDIYFQEWGDPSVTTPPVTAPPAGSNTLYTSYLASEQGTSLGNYALQTFTPQTTHTVKQVKLNLYNSGAAGTLTVSIRAANPSTGEPSGGDLATSGSISETTLPAAWSTPSFDLGSGYLLQAGTKYAIYLRSTATGLFGRVDTAGTYSGGSYMVSSNGLSWTNRALWDIYFQDWGTP